MLQGITNNVMNNFNGSGDERNGTYGTAL